MRDEIVQALFYRGKLHALGRDFLIDIGFRRLFVHVKVVLALGILELRKCIKRNI